MRDCGVLAERKAQREQSGAPSDRGAANYEHASVDLAPSAGLQTKPDAMSRRPGGDGLLSRNDAMLSCCNTGDPRFERFTGAECVK